MNTAEFARWLDLHLGAFPDTRSWLAGLPDPNKTMESWERALGDVSEVSATEVTHRMERGDLEAPEGFKRERTAAMVRAEAKKVVIGWTPKNRVQGREPRYDCPVCQDRGSVTVWAQECVDHVKRTGEAPPRRVTDCVACNCPKGNGLATEKNDAQHRWKALTRYDEAFHCRTIYGTPGKADIANLLEWVGTPKEPAVTLWEP